MFIIKTIGSRQDNSCTFTDVRNPFELRWSSSRHRALSRLKEGYLMYFYTSMESLRLRGFSSRHHPIQMLKGGTIMALKNEIRTKVQEQWKRLIKAYTTFKMLEGHTRGDKLCMSNSRPFQVERVLESSSSNPNA